MWKCLLGLPYLIVKLWKSGESDCKSKMRKNKYIKKERKKPKGRNTMLKRMRKHQNILPYIILL